MAFDKRNDYFYKAFRGGDGNTYTLTFFPATHQDIVTGVGNELPDDVTFDVCEVKAGKPDNLPWGLEKTRTLKLKFDLHHFDTPVWGEVATWMLNARSDSTRSVNSIDMYIPNRWTLYNDTDSVEEFNGFQSITAKETLEISANREYELECIGKYKSILERVDFDALDFGTAFHTRTNHNIYDLVYESPPIGDALFTWENYASLTYHFYRTRDIFQSIRDYAINIMKAFFRDGASPNYEMFDIDDIDDIWSFHKQDTDLDETHPAGDLLGFAGLMLCGKIDFKGDDRGGFFIDSSGIKTYNNAWSFLRQFCDSLLLKIRFSDASGSYFKANFYKMFDTISTNQDIEATDKNQFTLKKKPNLVTQTACYIVGSKSGDVAEIKLKTETGNIDGDSEEVELIFNNYLLGYFQPDQFDREFEEDSNGRYEKHNESLRTLYYKETSDNVYKIHESCGYDLGDGVTMASNADYLLFANEYPRRIFFGGTDFGRKTLHKFFQKQYKSRLSFYGMAYIRNLVIQYVRGDVRHMSLEGKLSNFITGTSNVSIHQLGNTYDVAIDNLSNIDAISNFLTKGILTSCDYDYIKGEADAVFFLRGDSLVL